MIFPSPPKAVGLNKGFTPPGSPGPGPPRPGVTAGPAGPPGGPAKGPPGPKGCPGGKIPGGKFVPGGWPKESKGCRAKYGFNPAEIIKIITVIFFVINILVFITGKCSSLVYKTCTLFLSFVSDLGSHRNHVTLSNLSPWLSCLFQTWVLIG